MAKNSKNLLTLIDECEEHELNVSLDILRSDLACWDNNVSWLPLLDTQLELYKEVGILNLYDKIRMLVELRKLAPKVIKLQNDLTNDIQSLRHLCYKHPLNFKISLSQNLLEHRKCPLSKPNSHLDKSAASGTQERPAQAKLNSERIVTASEKEFPTTSRIFDFEEQIYPAYITTLVRSLDKCKTCTIRVYPDTTVSCLLCNFQGTQLNGTHLKQHVAGKNHLRNVELHSDNLRKYQNFWKGCSKEYRELQFQFDFVDDRVMECVKCKNNVSFKSVCMHTCSGKARRFKVCTKASYSPLAESTIFHQVPYVSIGENSYPMFQRVDQKLFCLFCNKNVDTKLKSHINGMQHINKLMPQLAWDTVRLYHEIWMLILEQDQPQQIYFRRRSDKMTCLACSISMDYDVTELREHLYSKTHKRFVRAVPKKLSTNQQNAVRPASTSSAWSSTESSSNSTSGTSRSDSSTTLESVEDVKTDSAGPSGFGSSIVADASDSKTDAESIFEGLSQLNIEGFLYKLSQLTSQLNSSEVFNFQGASAESHVDGTPKRLEEVLDDSDTLQNTDGTPIIGVKRIENINKDPLTASPNMPPKKPKSPKKKIDATTEQKAPTNAQTCPQIPELPPYDKTVTDTLYPDGLLHYNVTIGNVKYPIIQNIGPYKHCLVCAENLSGILFHLNSLKHDASARKETNRALLKSYHDVFLRLPSHLQIEQQNFRMESTLLCILCDAEINYDAAELLEHLRTDEHTTNRMRLENPDFEEPDSDEFPTENIKAEVKSAAVSPVERRNSPVKPKIEKQASPAKVKIEKEASPVKVKTEKDAIPVNVKPKKASSPAKPKKDWNEAEYVATLRQIYPVDLSKTVREREGIAYSFDTYQAEWGTTQFRCLVCERSFERSDLIQHVTTKAHRKRCMKPGRLKAIEIYHFRWNTMALKHKVRQQEFSPVNASFTFCRTCCLNVKYGELADHIGRFHLSGKEYPLVDKINPEHTHKSDVSYAPEILSTIYRNNEPLCNLIALNTSYPLIQTGRVVMRCLLCKQDIAYDESGFRDAAAMDTVRAHLGSDRHRAKMRDIEAKGSLKEYHNAWMSFKPDVQRQQLLFFGDGDSLFCNLCGCTVKTARVGRHVAETARHHDLEFDEFGEIILKAGQPSPKTKDAKKQALLQHLGVETDDTESSGDSDPSTETELSDDLSTTMVFESTSNGSPKNKNVVANGYATVEDSSGTDLTHKIPEVNTAESAKSLSIYKPSVRNRIYYGLHGYLIKIDGCEYPVLRRTMLGLRCIVCGDGNVSDVEEHLKGVLHERRCADTLAVTYVKQYHQFWSKLRESMQHEQIFLINDQCLLCHKEIPYENVYSHTTSKSHTNKTANATNEVLHQALGLKFQYDPDVHAALYASVPSQDQITVDGVSYPVLRSTEQGTRCVVCDDEFVRSADDHFSKQLHRELVANRDNLQRFAKFHRFWMSQEPANQMEQRHMAQGRCLLCDKRVANDGVLAHLRSKGHIVQAHQASKKAKSRLENTGKHDIRDSVANPTAGHMINQLPLYLSGHLPLLDWNDELEEVGCKNCKKVCFTVYELRLHLDSQQHVDATRVQRKKLKFHCELCKKWYPCETTWNLHLIDPVHTDQCSKVGPDRRAKLKEQLCVTCSTVIFGDRLSIIRHESEAMPDGEPQVKLSKAVKNLFASREFVLEESRRLLQLATLAARDQEKEDQCCTALVKAVKESYPNCCAHPFGSRVTILGYEDSDLDVFLDIGGMYDGKRLQGATSQADIVHTVAAHLQRNRKLFTDINKVPSARTPIVQVYHTATGIDCDISFRHGLSVENTAFISFCLDLQPSVRAAMLYLKEWYAKSGMPTGVTSYALIMMFVYYLQTEGYLFSVARIRELTGASGPIINGWETVKYTKPLTAMKLQVPDCTMSVPELLQKFFGFYATFDFETLVVCPLLGRPILKKDFNLHKNTLPDEMRTYVRKLCMPNPEVFRLTAMCVQDPFDLSHNLTKACSATYVRRFTGYCSLTKVHIEAF